MRTRSVVSWTFIVAMCFCIAIVVPGTMAGFNSKIVNAQNTLSVGTRTLTIKDSNNTVQCTSAPLAATPTLVPSNESVACNANLLPAMTPATGSGESLNSLIATGTAVPSEVNLSADSCGPAKLSNAVTGINPLLPRFGLTYGADGPGGLANSTAISFDGVRSVATSVAAETAPLTFTILLWYKTSLAGTFIQFSSEPGSDTKPTSFDRSLYILPAGNVRFSMNPIGVTGRAATTGGTYGGGLWHMVTATVDARTSTTYMTIQIDNRGPATFSYPTNETGSLYPGYWRIGHGFTTGYLTGEMSNVVIWPSVLTNAETNLLYGSVNQATFKTRIYSVGTPSHFWPLSDTGRTTFGGPYPVIGAVSPCQDVQFSVGTETTCITPSGADPCTAFESERTLASMVESAPLIVNTPTVESPQQLAIKVQRGPFYQSSFEYGLQLYLPVTLREVSFSRKFSWTFNRLII